MANRRFRAIRIVTTVLLALMPTVTRADELVDFQREIRPILAEHCLQCHGPDEAARQADLRLDVREFAISAPGSGEFAIVPGNPDASQLLLRIAAHDPDFLMPPPDQKNPLQSEQIVLLRRWISEGAA